MLPNKIRKTLQKEAKEWEAVIAVESAEQVQKLLNEADFFKVPRPAREPVSISLYPFNFSMIKRLARQNGIPQPNSWLYGFTKELSRIREMILLINNGNLLK